MDFDLTDSQREIRQKAREIAESKIAPKAAHWDETEEYPWENAQILADAGFMGMNIPMEFGGPERPLIEAVLVVEEMAKVCGITGRIVVDSNMGVVGAIIKYGTEEQKRKYLPMVLAGDKPAIVITEPEAGSAATDMTTRAVLDGDEYILNGKKKWITGAGVSHINLVFARVAHGGDEQGIGALIVELGAEGFPHRRAQLHDGTARDSRERGDFRKLPRAPSENLVTVGFGRLMAAYNAQRVGAGTVALGSRRGRLRPGGGIREKAPPVRPPDFGVPGASVDSGGRPHPARRRAAPAPPRGGAGRPEDGLSRDAPRGHRQDVFGRSLDQGDERRAPDIRSRGLFA